VLELHVLGLLCARAHPRVAGLAEWRGELEERLTGAQKRVLPLLIAGMSDNQIAAQLGSSRYTIHDHVKAIFEKWGIRSRFELMQIWRMPGERGADRAKAATRIEQDAAPARP
jgi:DNA-binding NarL/FixJ family response regulator